MVALNNLYGCVRCNWGRRSGQLDKLTSVHWSLTNIIIQLRCLRQEKSARHREVREFLVRQHISSLLSIRVRRHVDRSQPQRIRDNADSLRQTSTELMVDLLEEMRAPALSAHPFFLALRTKHPDLVRELCQSVAGYAARDGRRDLRTR